MTREEGARSSLLEESESDIALGKSRGKRLGSKGGGDGKRLRVERRRRASVEGEEAAGATAPGRLHTAVETILGNGTEQVQSEGTSSAGAVRIFRTVFRLEKCNTKQ